MEKIIGIQEPRSIFHTGYPLSIRIWHWLTFLFFTCSVITVFFATVVFETRDNISMVQEQVMQKGGTISPEQAKAVAHEYNDKLWELHKFIGFGLCFLLLFRAIIEIRSNKEQKLITKLKKAISFQPQTASGSTDRRHYLWVKWGYLLFYTLLLIMAVTGLGLSFEDVTWLKQVRHTLGEIHEFCQYLLYGYVVFHIIGVIRADVTNNQGIVSRMINGKHS